MKRRDTFRDFVLEQLRDVAGVSCRAMFGGHGLFQDGKMFGILFKSRLYLKVGPRTRPAYEKAGMKPFHPSARMTLRSYYEAPADVLENATELGRWASAAIRAAATGLR
jgi:DNA transformation protein and related proteins